MMQKTMERFKQFMIELVSEAESTQMTDKELQRGFFNVTTLVLLAGVVLASLLFTPLSQPSLVLIALQVMIYALVWLHVQLFGIRKTIDFTCKAVVIWTICTGLFFVAIWFAPEFTDCVRLLRWSAFLHGLS